MDREYELVLMLDPDVPDERRDEIAAETRKRIEAGATLKGDTSWGMRKMAYEIRQRTEADYRLFRFEGQSGVLDDLNHNLRIADGVLRFRIFKVDPRAPSVAPPPPVMTSGAPPQRGPRRQEAPAQEAPAQDAAPEASQEPEQAQAEPEAAEPEAAQPEAAAEESPAPAADAPEQAESAPEPAELAPEPATEEPAPESGEEPSK